MTAQQPWETVLTMCIFQAQGILPLHRTGEHTCKCKNSLSFLRADLRPTRNDVEDMSASEDKVCLCNTCRTANVLEVLHFCSSCGASSSGKETNDGEKGTREASITFIHLSGSEGSGS